MKLMKLIRHCSMLIAALSTLLFVPAQAAISPHAPTADDLKKLQQWQRDVARVLWQKPEADPQTLIVGYNPFTLEKVKKDIAQKLWAEADVIATFNGIVGQWWNTFGPLDKIVEDFLKKGASQETNADEIIVLQKFLNQRLKALEYTHPGVTAQLKVKNAVFLDDSFAKKAQEAKQGSSEKQAGVVTTLPPLPVQPTHTAPAPAPTTAAPVVAQQPSATPTTQQQQEDVTRGATPLPPAVSTSTPPTQLQISPQQQSQRYIPLPASQLQQQPVALAATAPIQPSQQQQLPQPLLAQAPLPQPAAPVQQQQIQQQRYVPLSPSEQKATVHEPTTAVVTRGPAPAPTPVITRPPVLIFAPVAQQQPQAAQQPTQLTSQEVLNDACAKEVFEIINTNPPLSDPAIQQATGAVQKCVDALNNSFPNRDTNETERKKYLDSCDYLRYKIIDILQPLRDTGYNPDAIAQGKKITMLDVGTIIQPSEQAHAKVLEVMKKHEEARPKSTPQPAAPAPSAAPLPPASTPLVELPEPKPSAERDKIIRQILEISELFPTPASLTFEAGDRKLYYLAGLNKILSPHYSLDQRSPICSPKELFLHAESFPFKSITELPRISDEQLQEVLKIAQEAKEKRPKGSVTPEDAIEMYTTGHQTYGAVKSVILTIEKPAIRDAFLLFLEQAKAEKEKASHR